MLVQRNDSVGSRGWEENSSELIETNCSTLEEYVREYIKEDWDLETDKDVENFINESDEWSLSENECSCEGDESTTTFVVFEPTQEYVDMLLRNM